MAKKIKKISQKLKDGSFSELYPIGADGENIDLKNGKNLEEEVKSIENNFPILKKSINGQPENININDLTPGVLWFILDDNNTVKGISQLKNDKTFTEPILLNMDITNVELENDIKNIINNMGFSSVDNYKDLLETVLNIIKLVPVSKGGTGKTSISKNKILIGSDNNTFSEIGIDSAPLKDSNNLISSNAVYQLEIKVAPKNHASSSLDYGRSSQNNYGHVKISNDYTKTEGDPDYTALNITGANRLFTKLQDSINNSSGGGGGGNFTDIQMYEGKELSDFTWQQIKDKCNNNDFSGLRVGDYKTITLSDGHIFKMKIAGIDTYYRAASFSDQYQNLVINHHIDWISYECLKDSSNIKWNNSNSNNGNSQNVHPWSVSYLKNYLNSTVYNKLPSDLKNIISNKRLIMEGRYSSNNSKLTNSVNKSVTDMGILWLPTEYEVYGSIIYGTKPHSAGSGIQYPLFINSSYNRIKCNSSTNNQNRTSVQWWLSTVADNSYEKACCVSAHGAPLEDYVTSYYGIGVPICFRISADGSASSNFGD